MGKLHTKLQNDMPARLLRKLHTSSDGIMSSSGLSIEAGT